jgi:hypothetical protein
MEKPRNNNENNYYSGVNIIQKEQKILYNQILMETLKSNSIEDLKIKLFLF